jgi:hypothetical protein
MHSSIPDNSANIGVNNDIRGNRMDGTDPKGGEMARKETAPHKTAPHKIRQLCLPRNNATSRVRRGLTALGTAAALVAAGAAPASAFAPVGGDARGFGSTTFDNTAGARLTTCQNVLSGKVTSDNGPGRGGEIRIDHVSFSPCDPAAGISVTARGLPWTLQVDSSAGVTVEGVDLNLVKGGGTCRYTGTLGGARSFDGVYSISGALARQSSGCDGPRRLGLSVLAESITVNGIPLNP